MRKIACSLLLLIAIGCNKAANTSVTKVEIKLIDKTGATIANDSVSEFYSFRISQPPDTGFGPYGVLYSERQSTSANGIATFLIPDSIFRYQTQLATSYWFADTIGGRSAPYITIHLSKGDHPQATLQLY